MSSAAPATPLEQEPLSATERIVDTFVAPTKTFTDLRRSANWLVPFLLLTVVTLVLVFVADKKVGMGKIVENQLALQPKRQAQLDALPAEKRTAQMDVAITINRAFSYASPLIILIFLVIVAAILLASFNFGFGTQLSFNQCLAVCTYASLPGIIKALLAILVIAVGGGEAFTFQNPIASNLSPLVDMNSHFLYSIAVSLDLFTIWTLVLTGIGFSCLTKVKRGACMGVVFGWWAASVLVGAGIAAAFS